MRANKISHVTKIDEKDWSITNSAFVITQQSFKNSDLLSSGAAGKTTFG